MPFQPLPRLLPVLASVLAAGVMLTVASCSHVTPLGRVPWIMGRGRGARC